MNRKLLSLFGIKFNPFSHQIPPSALWVSPQVKNFCWRIENQILEGGFALLSGEPGTGKSATLRILSDHLNTLPDVSLGILTRPQAQIADFYRELGHLYSIPLSPHNRWNSSKFLRDKWLTHLKSSMLKPILILDEAQEMNSAVLSELRLLSSAELDSRSLLTIILAGDDRLILRLQSPDLIPIAGRVRSRLHLCSLSPDELLTHLIHLLEAAGNASFIAEPVLKALVSHSNGNLRLLMNFANELLSAAISKQVPFIDEDLLLETIPLQTKKGKAKPQTVPF